MKIKAVVSEFWNSIIFIFGKSFKINLEILAPNPNFKKTKRVALRPPSRELYVMCLVREYGLGILWQEQRPGIGCDL